MSDNTATPVLRLERRRASFLKMFRLPAIATSFNLLVLTLLGSLAAGAQTAHFGGAISIEGSGFIAPYGVAVDGSGNVFVADTGHNAVKVILQTGAINTLGTGFSDPNGVAVDGSGNVFVADTGNNAVKEILAAGGYTTVNTLGSGFSGPYGVAVDGSGNVFVADTGHSAVKEILAAGGYTTVNTLGGGFSSPDSVAVDGSGNVFVADSGNNAVKEILAAGGYATIHPLGSGFSNPNGVALDAGGNVFVADTGNGAFDEILAAGGYANIISLSTGGFVVFGLAVDKNENVFITADSDNVVLKAALRGVDFGSVSVGTSTPVTLTLNFTFDTGGTIQAPSVVTQGLAGLDFTDAGTGSCTTNGTSYTYSAGETCTVDVTFTPINPGQRTGAVELLSSNGSIVTAYVNGVGLAGQAGFEGASVISTLPVSALPPPANSYPLGITTDAAGNVYIGENSTCLVIKKTIATGVSSVVAGNGTCANSPSGIGGPATSATLTQPTSVAVNGRGDILVASSSRSAIYKIDARTGIITTVAGTPGSRGYSPDGTLATSAQLYYPFYVTVDNTGNFYTAESSIIRKVDAMTGLLTTVAGNHAAGAGYSGDGGLATNAQMNFPYGIAFDAQNNLYIADEGNNAVRKVDASTGVITTVAGTPGSAGYAGDGGPATSAKLNDPEDLSFDGAGNLYIADSTNLVVRKVSAQTGIITTIAGVFNSNHTDTYTGDGGAANLAGLSYFESATVGPDGTLYIADGDNGVIRSVTQSHGTAAFGSFNVGTASPAMDVTATNNGNAALNLSALLASTNFNLNGLRTSCSGSTVLASGASCILGVEFLPTAAGVLTGSVTLTDDNNNVPASTQSVSLSGTGVATPATQVVVSGLPTTIAMGTSVSFQASLEDSNGNVAATSGTTVTVTVTSPGGSTQTVTATTVNGVATLNLSGAIFSTSGVYTITASSSGLTSASAMVTVAAAASKLAASAVPSTIVSGGNLGTVTATVEDANGNTVTTSTAAVTATITGPNGYSQTVTSSAVNGVASLNLSSLPLTTPGTYTVATSSPGLTGTSSTVNVILSVAPREVNFGSVNVGTSAPVTMTLTFTFSTAGTIQAPSVVTQGITGLDFTDAGTGTCTTNGTSHAYNAGDSCTVDVTFNPKAPGQRTGALELIGSSGPIATAYVYGVGLAGQAGFEGASVITTLPVSALPANAYPFYISTDDAGNLYIPDAQNCVLVKYTAATGMSSVVAGSGSCGNMSGIGGPATNATFNTLSSVAVSGRGDIFVSDHNLGVIYKIDVHTGILSIVAGTPGPAGYSPDGTLATSAQLNQPYFIAVDKKNDLYFTDSANNLVRRVDAITGLLTTVAGNFAAGVGYSGDGGLATNAQLRYPDALAFDVHDNLYIADTNNNVIRKVDVATSLITTVAGRQGSGYSGDGGPATSAQFNDPEGLSVDAAGNLYIEDDDNYVVRKVNAQTGIITTIVGVYNSSGTQTYTGDGGAANLAGLSYNEGLAIAPDGTLYIADSNNNVIRSVTQPHGTAAFGSFNVGTPSPAMDVTATNDGNADLNLSALVASTNFNLNGLHTSCSGSTVLASGASCVLGIEFQPTAAGALTGSVTLTDDNNDVPASTQSVSLSGTGIATPATQVVVSGLPATIAMGMSVLFQASLEDSNGYVVATSGTTITVTVTSPSGSTQAVSATTVNGVTTLNLSSTTFPTPGVYTIVTSSTGLTSANSAVTVTAGAATQVVTNSIPTTLAAGANLGTIVATIKDAGGNTVTSSAAPVTIVVTGPDGSTSTLTVHAVSGVANLNFSSIGLTLAGTYTVTTSSPGLTGATASVVVTVGAASQLVVAQIGFVVSPGNAGLAAVTVQDAYGNTVANSTAPITGVLTGPNGYAQTVVATASHGVASINLSPLLLTISGNYDLTATSPGITQGDSSFRVKAGAATHFVTSAVAATLVSGDNLGRLTLTFQDAYGNTDTSFAGPFTVQLTGPNGYLQTVTGRAVEGSGSINLSSLGLTTAGTYTVTTSSTGVTGTSSTVTVTAGTASNLVLSTVPSSINSGQSLGAATATIKDANGNTVISYTGPITATLIGANGYSQAATGTAVNGVANLNLSSLAPTAAGIYTLTATGAGLTSVSQTTTVAAAPQTIPLTLPNVTYGVGPTMLPSTTSAGLPVAYAVTGPATLNASSLTITGAGTVAITATQAGNAVYSPVTLTQSFTVAKAATSTTLSSSGVAAAGSSVTLTAQVASAAGTPTGTVNFLNGSTVLGSATASSTGFATLTLSTLPTGALSLTAAYVGDANFLASGSAASTTDVQDFGIAATAGTPSVPVVPGAAANFTLALTPGTTGFSSAITLTATGLPAGATYSFSPATVTPGSATASTVLTVQTSKAVTIARGVGQAAGVAFALLFLPLGFSRRGREALKRTRLLSAAGVLLLLGGMAGLTGCGSTNGFFGKAPQSYTITVTGTSGTLVHSTTVVLNVQ